MCLGWLECHSTTKNIVSSIPGQGTYLGCRFDHGLGAYGRQLIDAFLSPTLSKINKTYLWVRVFLKKVFIYLFLERGEGGEKERERNISVWLPLTRPLLGTWPTTQACAPTGNWTKQPFGSQAST